MGISCRKVCTLAVVMVSFLLLTVSVSSATDCKSATIMKIGFNPSFDNATTSGGVIQLDCNDDTKWSGTVQFYMTANLGDQGLATILTAFAMSKPIWARTSGPASGDLLQIVYVNK